MQNLQYLREITVDKYNAIFILVRGGRDPGNGR